MILAKPEQGVAVKNTHVFISSDPLEAHGRCRCDSIPHSFKSTVTNWRGKLSSRRRPRNTAAMYLAASRLGRQEIPPVMGDGNALGDAQQCAGRWRWGASRLLSRHYSTPLLSAASSAAISAVSS